ncbi:unnamed protein product, partial [Rotaria sp. Silwood1]
MIYAVDSICDILKHSVSSFSPMNMITQNNNHKDTNDKGTLKNTALKFIQGTVSNIAGGQDVMKASVTSAISVAGEYMNSTNLINLTAGFLPSNQNPQTASCSSETSDQVSESYKAIRSRLLFDIKTNFFGNVVFQIHQYKSIT